MSSHTSTTVTSDDEEINVDDLITENNKLIAENKRLIETVKSLTEYNDVLLSQTDAISEEYAKINAWNNENVARNERLVEENRRLLTMLKDMRDRINGQECVVYETPCKVETKHEDDHQLVVSIPIDPIRVMDCVDAFITVLVVFYSTIMLVSAVAAYLIELMADSVLKAWSSITESILKRDQYIDHVRSCARKIKTNNVFLDLLTIGAIAAAIATSLQCA